MTQATAALPASASDGPAPAAVRLRTPLLGVAVAAFAVALAFLPGHALVGSRTAADEPQYLLTAISLAEDHSLDLADELSAARWRDFAGHDLPRQTEPTPEGREISPHDPGLPVLLAVPVAVGGWAGAKVALAVVNGALAAVLLWTAVRRFGVSPRVAMPVVLALTLAPPFAVYGAQIYPELPGALCVAGIVALTGARHRRRFALGGVIALAVVAAWLSVKYVPVAGAASAVALWGWWRRGDRRDRLAVGGAVGAAAVLGTLYAIAHVAWYGGLTPYASGDFFVDNGGQLAVMGDHPDRVARSVRLLGLLVDRDFGLGAWQPLWLLVVPAIAVLLVRRPPRWAAIAAPLAVGWVMATWVAVTMHGWWFPGRHLVHALPCAVLAVAWWLERLPAGRAVAWAGVALGAVSSLWLATQAAFDDVTIVFDPWATTDPVLRLMQPLLPNMRDHGIGVGVRYVSWLVLLVGAAALAVRHELRRRSVLDDVVAEPVA
jgi:hypothetical protein